MRCFLSPAALQSNKGLQSQYYDQELFGSVCASLVSMACYLVVLLKPKCDGSLLPSAESLVGGPVGRFCQRRPEVVLCFNPFAETKPMFSTQESPLSAFAESSPWLRLEEVRTAPVEQKAAGIGTPRVELPPVATEGGTSPPQKKSGEQLMLNCSGHILSHNMGNHRILQETLPSSRRLSSGFMLVGVTPPATLPHISA